MAVKAGMTIFQEIYKKMQKYMIFQSTQRTWIKLNLRNNFSCSENSKKFIP